MKIINVIAGAGVAAAIVGGFFQVRSCNGGPSLKHDSTVYWQAVAARASDSSKKARKDLDSMRISDSTHGVQWAAEKAQLLKRIADKDMAVNQEKAKIGDLSLRYWAAKAMADTANQLITCDSAFNELKQAKIAVTDLQESYGGAIQSFGNELNRRDSAIQVLTDIGYRFQRANDSLRRANDGQARENVRLAKIAGKRFSIGPSVGAAIVGGKAQPIVGATVTYTILRF